MYYDSRILTELILMLITTYTYSYSELDFSTPGSLGLFKWFEPQEEHLLAWT